MKSKLLDERWDSIESNRRREEEKAQMRTKLVRRVKENSLATRNSLKRVRIQDIRESFFDRDLSDFFSIKGGFDFLYFCNRSPMANKILDPIMTNQYDGSDPELAKGPWRPATNGKYYNLMVAFMESDFEKRKLSRVKYHALRALVREFKERGSEYGPYPNI